MPSSAITPVDYSQDTITFLRDDGFHNRVKLALALTNAVSIDSVLDKTDSITFTLNNLVFQKTEQTNEITGAITPAVRTTFILEDGRMLTTTSAPLFDNVKTIIGTMGTPLDWPEPQKFTISVQKSKQGRRYYSIIPVFVDEK